MRPWLLVLTSLAMFALEGALLASVGAGSWSLQTPVAVTLYVGLRRDFPSGALILCALLLPAEWLSGAPQGLYGAALVATFLAAQPIGHRLQREFGLPQILLGALGFSLHQLIMILVLLAWDPSSPLVGALGWTLLPSALGGALTLGIVGAIFERLGRERRTRL